MLVQGLTEAAAVVVLRVFIHKYMLSRQKTLNAEMWGRERDASTTSRPQADHK